MCTLKDRASLKSRVCVVTWSGTTGVGASTLGGSSQTRSATKRDKSILILGSTVVCAGWFI